MGVFYTYIGGLFLVTFSNAAFVARIRWNHDIKYHLPILFIEKRVINENLGEKESRRFIA